MKCPFCTSSDSRVLETRVSDDWVTVRRRRECAGCFKRFTTYERVEHSPLFVIKKDGRRETFDREKLRRGLFQACEGTQVARNQIERIVEAIEGGLRTNDKVEVSSSNIGSLVAEQLKVVDKVAYIRFASVFRRFVDLEEFEKELKRLL